MTQWAVFIYIYLYVHIYLYVYIYLYVATIRKRVSWKGLEGWDIGGIIEGE